jgi:hypothetical protein
MFTLQRSRPVLCADIFEEVNFHEYPGPPDLRPRDLAGARLVLQRDRMNLQERCGLLQVERAHGSELSQLAI